MSEIKTIKLEILRQGPPHNQLLSPLTNYIFLCGNHPPETVNIPFEHRQLLTRLRALRYKDTPETQRMLLEETAENLGNIFFRCPGLIAEMSVDEFKDKNMMIHFRLVLSATELALLPFELITSPNGFPGAGQPLSLQTELPVCITRETRRRVIKRFHWPEKPRILFISACPPPLPPIPLKAHCLTLRRVIDPWLEYDPAFMEKQNLEEKIGKYLKILLNASLEKIQKICSEDDFTHIHILAHGVPDEDEEGKHFGLALHKNTNEGKMEIVRGECLANALMSCQKDRQGAINSPAVVTIASCESGQTGSVIGTGASIAHAIHEAGIPLVVASQFPLSFMGSVIMTEVLYEELLQGNDPRELLFKVRKQLKTENCEFHDWASLVAYASFPPDMEKQLLDIQFKRIKSSIDAALNYADKIFSQIMFFNILNETSDKGSKNKTKDKQLLLIKNIDKIITIAEKAKQKLQEIPFEEHMKYLLLGSTDKRLAYILYRKWESTISGKMDKKTKQDMYKALEQSFDLIITARDYYFKAYKLKQSSSWPLVQYLSLTAYIDTIKDNDGIHNFYNTKENIPEPPEKENNQAPPPYLPEDLWNLAFKLAEYDLENPDILSQIWAHGDLCELYLLAPLVKNGGKNLQIQSKEKARFHTEQMIKLCKDNQYIFAIKSTYRQIRRYPAWFKIPNIQKTAIWIIGVFERDDFFKLIFKKTKF